MVDGPAQPFPRIFFNCDCWDTCYFCGWYDAQCVPIRINIEMIFVGAAVMRETLRVYFMGVGDFVMWCDFITRKISDINVVGTPLNTTDVFDSATGKWSTAELSVARDGIRAVSVGRFAIFAGGMLTFKCRTL